MVKKGLQEKFNEAFDELCRRQDMITLQLTVLEAWVMLSQLQLALRHPKNTGGSSAIAHKIADRLQKMVASDGALAEVAELGWRPEHDV